MNHSKEKAVPSFAEYIDLFLYTKILKSFWYVPKTWESKIDSSSWIQPLAFHELLHTLRESSLGNISYRDTWHFITACTSHNTDISALKINGYWTLNKTCLFHLHPVLLLSLCSLASRYSASQLKEEWTKEMSWEAAVSQVEHGFLFLPGALSRMPPHFWTTLPKFNTIINLSK